MKEYIVGIDSYKKKENWFYEIIKKLKLRKHRYTPNSPFKLVLDSDYIKTKDLLQCNNNGAKLQVLEVPKLTFMSKIKKFFGFNRNLIYKYNIKFK